MEIIPNGTTTSETIGKGGQRDGPDMQCRSTEWVRAEEELILHGVARRLQAA